MDYMEAQWESKLARRKADDRKRGFAPARYSVRDRLGRFTKCVPYEVCKFETGFYNADDGTTHGHPDCGGLKNRIVTHDDHVTGWMCVCITTMYFDIPSPDWNWAPSDGVAECESCGVFYPLTSFPTATDSGYRFRDTRVCRKCTSDRRAAARETVAEPAANGITAASILDWLAAVGE